MLHIKLKLVHKENLENTFSYKFENEFYIIIVEKNGKQVHVKDIVPKDKSYPNISRSKIGYNLNVDLNESKTESEKKDSIKKSLKAIKTIEEIKYIERYLKGDIKK